ncbi:helix-turn-helix transcriptional regulator [Acetivibrio cellulolyticus]|uniref:helix-turn-helix transcriptional regulator n=1 Tax=Acetivibrio cellulolyticus TaxID=35830 RepID=UPI0002481C5D|nr:helix-turn-helix transcriptional regulator [Acetivibrio cellulolyticus]
MLNENLKKIRKEKGLTQVQLSEILGIAQTTYAGYETGRYEPDIGVVGASVSPGAK